MFNGPIPQIYSRPATFGCAMPMPFVARPVMPAPIFGCCSSPFMPSMGCMPAPAFPTFTMPFAFAMPFLAPANIFIQNMMITAARLVTTYRQQAAMRAQLQAANNYRFGSLTASRGTASNNNTGFWANYPSGSSLLTQVGYCASSGLRLARTALSRAVGFTGWCARYVKNAIASCGLGQPVCGDAHEMIRILRNNKNFREIPARGVDPRTLPAGCILVYGKGVAGYSSKYGHTEITTGDGRAVSDGITNNIRGNVTAIFVPVA